LPSARVLLPDYGVAASRELDSLAPVEEMDVSTVESTDQPSEESIASSPILYAEDLKFRSPVRLESPSMPILELY